MKEVSGIRFENRFILSALSFVAIAVMIGSLPLRGDEINRNDGELSGLPAESRERDQRQSEAGKRLSPLAVELLGLQRKNFETPEARRQAVLQWRTVHGAALKVEIDARREAERPARELLQKEAANRFS
jgi:hypothetical protein